MIKTIKRWFIRALALTGILVAIPPISVRAGTIYDSPYVTFAPDGRAFTMDDGNRNVEWYAEDGSDDFLTGIHSTLQVKRGEHLYGVKRMGSVPVGKWHVKLSKVNCCHIGYPVDDDYHGISFRRQVCLQPHFSAWQPICADCGEPIVNWNIYMSKAAARSLTYFQMSPGLEYYYLCPFNANLEQGVETGWHTCKAVSANRYLVKYIANGPESEISGYMEPTFHFFNDATMYEGKAVTPWTTLRKNTYRREGYAFAGWNTKPDGSGFSFDDEEGIYNLSEEDYGLNPEKATVFLYAMWEKNQSHLMLIMESGSYDGQAGEVQYTRSYGEQLTLQKDKVSPPVGNVVFFESNGGTPVDPIESVKSFLCWQPIGILRGKFDGKTYYYLAPDGNVDYLMPLYENGEIVLPETYKENMSFAGWYYDEELTQLAGRAGECITPAGDMKLYACFVGLVLHAKDNYQARGGTGAVDLDWQQNDMTAKRYKLFQSDDQSEWYQITEQSQVIDEKRVSERINYSGQTGSYQVPEEGIYTITAYGAQGGNYGAYTGGLGGMVQIKMWLKKGDMLTLCAGGQNGFNGGGKATKYGNGGGCSTVSLNGERILVAGGGGGAGGAQNGYPGGATQELLSTGLKGGDGLSGGGGGYNGGTGGSERFHIHVPGECFHVHEGKVTHYGGCYTIPVLCDGSMIHQKSKVEHWYWAGVDRIFCPACGADATKGESCSGHDTIYYNHSCIRHGFRVENTRPNSPSQCDVVLSYRLGCDKSTDYICGYRDGESMGIYPGFGGSNYVSEEGFDADTQMGVCTGNGYITIYSNLLGMMEQNILLGVAARDEQSPDCVDISTVEKSAAGENKLKVTWKAPQDKGSTYYHKVESYSLLTGARIGVSNITANRLISGVSAYFVRLDDSDDTVYGRGAVFRTIIEPQFTVELTEDDQYLHLAVVDVAGNVSPTVHVPIGSTTGTIGEVTWPLYTKPLQIEESDSVYERPQYYASGESLFYVRCDGRTPFLLTHTSYMEGPASRLYQINYAQLETSRTGEKVLHSIKVPSQSRYYKTYIFEAEELQFSTDRDPILQEENELSAKRTEYGRYLMVRQAFSLAANNHGKELFIVPIAGADKGDTIVYSDRSKDLKNGLHLVGDCEAPIISGVDLLRAGNNVVTLRAEDSLSGVRDFYVEIHNFDNDGRRLLYPDSQGKIHLDVSPTEALFSGDYAVHVIAHDNVGNERVEQYATCEMDLRATITRDEEPGDPIFYPGETGKLKVQIWGYADRLEITFPEEMSGYSHEYVYEVKTDYLHEEELPFSIPWTGMSAGTYEVIVRAFKGDRQLAVTPQFVVLEPENAIHDGEIRTRLR